MPFQKGNKLAKGGARPNPGPKPSELRKLCAVNFKDGIGILREIAHDKKSVPRDRIAAIQVFARVAVPGTHELPDGAGGLYYIKEIKSVNDDDL